MSTVRALAIGAAVWFTIATVGCSDDGKSSPTSTPPAPDAVRTEPTVPTPQSDSPGALSRPAFGYRLEYPLDWFYRGSGESTAEIINHELLGSFAETITVDESGEYGHPPSEATITVRVALNARGVTLDEWIDDGGTELSPASVIVSRAELTVGGEPAVEVTASPGLEGDVDSTITYVARGDRIYSIWMYPGSPEAAETHRAAYDLVVSSFEFTP